MSSFDNYIQGQPNAMVLDQDPSWSEKNQHLSFPDRARRRVFEYVNSRLEKTDTHVNFSENDVYVVWFSKTLKNWKALVSTTLPDGMYYEVTHNGYVEENGETYIDAYKKFDNVMVVD